MTEYIIVIIAAILTNNFVLVQVIGICPFLGVSKKLDSAFGMSCAVIFVMLIATAATWPIQTYILDPKGLGYLQTIVFILVIAALVQLVEITMKKYMPPLHKALGVFLPLITTNCAVLGVCVNNITDGYGFLKSMLSSLGAGLGFMLAMVLFAGVRGRIENNDFLPSFKGIPSTLIAASIVALSFMGFGGVIDGIFGM